MAVVESLGGEMLVPFKINSQGEGSEAWARLWHLFALNRPAFMERYMKRNNAESAFSAIKRKFGGSVRGRKHDQGLAPSFGKVA
jgi:transposase